MSHNPIYGFHTHMSAIREILVQFQFLQLLGFSLEGTQMVFLMKIIQGVKWRLQHKLSLSSFKNLID